MSLIWKLLKKHISVPQFVGFFIANIIGMTIILLAVQFYYDIKAVYKSEDSLMKDNYIIINKKVGTINSITGSDNSFNESDIDELKSQPFVKKLGIFTPSAFKVTAGFDIDNSINFSTDMFFESVPNEFVDVDKDKWIFNNDARELPIVIPKSYLDLYNFGFAQSQNLPKLSEGVLEAIKIDITIKSGLDKISYKGNIAGFSNRLNTILVPEDFMQFANKEFAPERNVGISRVVLVVENPADDRITSFLQDNNYETDEEKLDASKTNYLLRIIVSVVLIVGVIISLLAFYILMLSIYLLVEKNNSKLENLLLIGYSSGKIALPYQILTILLNVMVVIIAFLLIIIIRRQYLNLFENFFPQMVTPSSYIALFIGFIILIFMSIINFMAIRGKIRSIGCKKS